MATTHRTAIAIVASALLSAMALGAPNSGLPGLETFGKEKQQYVFFADGSPECRLIVPAKAEQEEREAAALIQRTFRDMGGGETVIVSEPAAAFDGVSIHVGRTSFARGLDVIPSDLDEDGFVIHPCDSRRLVLLGGRSVSTFYAATEFLERYAGVLWVWPGDHGTVVPKVSRLEAVVRAQTSEPAFRARKFSGIRRARMAYYRIHQKGRETRSNFHHNVFTVLKVRLHDTHPEYFSLVAGKRHRLGKSSSSNWQACTTDPETVQAFANAARRQFKRYPWISAFSVSQNDGHGFCDCERCRALDLPGVEGISDRYFTFMNAVADATRDEYPSKFISCLGYGRRGTRDVPARIKLRPNTLIYAVVPTLRHHHEEIVEWSKAAPNLGAYFWVHGKPVPKFYPRRWAQYLRFMREHNVREVYAEVYQDNPKRMATWELDGPRVWITAKLLWNPDADIDELMQRFCRRFYGAAHEPMLRYYRQCEKAWERREDPFDFGREWRALEFDLYKTADVDAMEGCVSEALDLAKGDETVTARLTALKKAFAPVAAYVRQLDLANVLAECPLRNRDDAEGLVARVHEAEVASRRHVERNRSLFGTLPSETEVAIDGLFSRITHLLGADAAAFWQKVESARSELTRFTTPQLLAISGKVTNIAANPSFETQRGSGKEADARLNWQALNAPGWGQWVRPGTRGRVGLATDVARTGTNSLVITGVEAACGIYTQRAKPGERYRVSCWAKTSVHAKAGQEREGGRLTLKWQTKEGKWMEGPPDCVAELPPGTTDWQRLCAIATIPSGVGRLVILLGAHDQAPGEQTWFDDLCIEKLCEAPVQE